MAQEMFTGIDPFEVHRLNAFLSFNWPEGCFIHNVTANSYGLTVDVDPQLSDTNKDNFIERFKAVNPKLSRMEMLTTPHKWVESHFYATFRP